MALLDETKEYLRIDGTDNDLQITAFISAAESYLTNAGVVKDETNLLYCLAVKMLVSHWYDNREAVGSAAKLAYGLASIIEQLKYCYPVVI